MRGRACQFCCKPKVPVGTAPLQEGCVPGQRLLEITRGTVPVFFLRFFLKKVFENLEKSRNVFAEITIARWYLSSFNPPEGWDFFGNVFL